MFTYASSEPPLRPSPRTLMSLNVTIGSRKLPMPSVAQAPIVAPPKNIAAMQREPGSGKRVFVCVNFRMLLLLSIVVWTICRRPFVTLRGRRRGHFLLQISPPLEAFGDFLLESEGSRLVEDAAAQLLGQVLLRD